MYLLTLIRGAELAEGVAPEARLPESLARFAIGRDPANPWPIPDRTLAISARHCEIVATAAGPVLRDLSTNGTFVNGAPGRLVGEHRLADGDVFELGPYAVRVSRSGQAKADPLHASAVGLQSAPPTEPALRTPGVTDTAPLRGGDPAAMLAAASAGPAPWGLTEILRNAPPASDSPVDVTKIRSAPKAGPQPKAHTPSSPASLPPPPAPLPAPAAPNTTSSGPLHPEAIAVAAVQALRQLLAQQAQARRQIGSRAASLQALRPLAALRMPATALAAVQSLGAPGADAAATLQCAADELAAHHDRLLAAFRGAAQRLAADIAPQALQAALGPAHTDAQKARLWDLYASVWQTMGTDSGSTWEQGLLDAALQHLAAAYDDPGQP
jgi:predicted component of type VI protein secretion system